MTTEPEFPDLNQLEAKLLAERQAYYDRIVARRDAVDSVLAELSEDDNSVDAFLRERLQRLLGAPTA